MTITQQQRQDLTLAVVACGHQIDADCIRLHRDPTKEGSALSQLVDRVAAVVAQSAPLAQQASDLPTYTDDLELRYVEACEERDHLRAVLARSVLADRAAAQVEPPSMPSSEWLAEAEQLLNGCAPMRGTDKLRAHLSKRVTAQVEPKADVVRMLTSAARDVLSERQRQIDKEGWTPEHDDGHDRGDLARAAGCYAIVAGDCQGWPNETYKGVSPPSCQTDDFEREHTFWPWKMSDWKPNHPRRDLVRAGALILAEIERLDRAGRVIPADGEVRS